MDTEMGYKLECPVESGTGGNPAGTPPLVRALLLAGEIQTGPFRNNMATRSVYT